MFRRIKYELIKSVRIFYSLNNHRRDDKSARTIARLVRNSVGRIKNITNDFFRRLFSCDCLRNGVTSVRECNPHSRRLRFSHAAIYEEIVPVNRFSYFLRDFFGLVRWSTARDRVKFVFVSLIPLGHGLPNNWWPPIIRLFAIIENSAPAEGGKATEAYVPRAEWSAPRKFYFKDNILSF